MYPLFLFAEALIELKGNRPQVLKMKRKMQIVNQILIHPIPILSESE